MLTEDKMDEISARLEKIPSRSSQTPGKGD
jgi:hypothetical protein